MTLDAKHQNVVIYGNAASASLIRYWLDCDSHYRVVGFCVDAVYRTEISFEGLPLVASDEIENVFPPSRFHLIIPLGNHSINGIRREKFEEFRRRGYSYARYVSSRSTVWEGCRVGENVIIYEGAVIQPFTTIGENCIIRSNVVVAHHSRVADHVFLANGVVTGGKCTIQEQVFAGLGSIIIDNINIAPRTFIGAGSVVIKSTDPDGVYVGNPARRLENKTALSVTGGE